MTCPLCQRRKARRQCPALDRQICAVCCGTKRLVEIRCPPDCGYLSASRAHPPATVQRQHQRDLTVMLPLMQGLTEPQSRLLLLMSGLVARHVAPDFQTLRDGDIAEAAAAVAATLETSSRGVIYEHRAATRPAQHLAEALKVLLGDVARDGAALAPAGARPAVSALAETPRVDQARLERDAAAALRRLEQGARAGAEGDAGYRELLGRLFRGQPEETGPRPQSESGLIVPKP